jgi:hypothetical protein
MADLKKYNSVCERVRKLLANWLNSGVELFLELKKIDDAGDWRAPGHATFADFLKAEFPNAIGIERYENVIRAFEVHGIGFVRKIGVHAAHATSVSALTQDPSNIKKLHEAVDRHIEKNRVPPEVNELRRMVRDITKIHPSRGTVRDMEREEALKETILRLKNELERARTRIKELEEENTRLKNSRPWTKPSKPPGKK